MLLDRKLSYVSIFIIFTALTSSCSSSQKSSRQQSKPNLGPFEFLQVVENASFTDLEGDTVAVSDFKGKLVLIDFWETWCKPCLNSFHAMQKALEKYPDDFVVLAVTPGWRDSKRDVKSFAKYKDYSFNYLMDSMSIHETLGVSGIPYKIYVDPDGNFIRSTMGSKGQKKDFEQIRNLVQKYK